jgi:hypothetical protein
MSRQGMLCGTRHIAITLTSRAQSDEKNRLPRSNRNKLALRVAIPQNLKRLIHLLINLITRLGIIVVMSDPDSPLMRLHHTLRQLMQRVLIQRTRIKHVTTGKFMDLHAARITHDRHLVDAEY